MLVTQQKVLRRFWYPVLPMEKLGEAPVPFTLLGQAIVIWKDETGAPAAAIDRCCHRTAKLSKGFCTGGRIACGYHGWEYDRTGACVRVPQWKDATRAPKFKIDAYRCAERYGYVWVALDEPLFGIPEIPEADDPAFRRIPEFYEPWNAGALRVLENSFDNAHFTFVHKSSFGDPDPTPSQMTYEEFPWGFRTHSIVHVKNPELQRKNLGIAEEKTTRDNTRTWFMPFFRQLRIRYPNGLVHCIQTGATPIDDTRSQIVQFVYRNDTEADTSAASVIAFDRQVTEEDRAVLEATESDVPLDAASGEEFHMPSDKPGLLMRKRLAALLAEAGETERRLAAARSAAE
ncbi:MAG: aromatic ring-hydroxylating dioxygenase subunit alpha [Azospirillum sp.]|nr:aromatic ring-hydroxylating dioxygenase subunit alpha [Azospirillum sp.]